ncbi:MAG: pyridoxamine 5'-phosphate oxidase family protein [Caldilineales bacterium]|nr:pyridoxamine 5'-phosphate oxidase family protein [Caldilineales bacterium]MCW5860166.1 pyridoxamine 5'-phosphate oxidase family protein [Caldilineales bacterium]
MDSNSTLATLLDQFAAAECSWFTSVRADGRPHSAPVWHVWHRGRAYVVTTAPAVKAANILVHPAVVLALPDPMNPIILEGRAAGANSARPELRPLFLAKYNWDLDSDPAYDTVIAVTPTKLMAWGKHGEGRWSGQQVAAVA